MSSFVLRKIIFLMLLSSSCFAQGFITTFDSRKTNVSFNGYLAIDVASIDSEINPFYGMFSKRVPLRTFYVPSLIDPELGIGVPITNGISNAVVQLNAILSSSVPATVRERTNPTTKEERKSRSDNLRAAPGWAQGKEDLARLAEEIELLWEEIERLKQ